MKNVGWMPRQSFWQPALPNCGIKAPCEQPWTSEDTLWHARDGDVVLPSSGLDELTLFDCHCSGLSAEGSAQVLALWKGRDLQLQVRGWFMLCLTASVLSSGLRRGSDKGQPATAVDREWQTLCKRAEVEAVTLAGPAAVPGVLQNTPHYLVWGCQNSCQVHCLGCTCVLWVSGQNAAWK